MRKTFFHNQQLRSFHALPVIDVSALVQDSASAANATSNNMIEANVRAAADELSGALKTTGFAYVVGHGLDEERHMAHVLREAEFFFALEDHLKEAISIEQSTSYRGYQRLGQNVTQGSRDMHEGFDAFKELPRDHPLSGSTNYKLDSPNQWPSESLPTFQPALEEYVEQMTKLGGILMRGVAIGLKLPRNTFDPFYSEGYWGLRAIAYGASAPPIAKEGETQDEGGDVGFGNLGCGEHTDYGNLTLLMQNNVKGCLQVKNRNDEWITADPVPGAILVNVGDMLQMWTSGQLRATPHRVLQPTAEQIAESGSSKRISVPFFFEPNYDAFVQPLLDGDATKSGNSGVMYGDHLYQKVSNNFA